MSKDEKSTMKRALEVYKLKKPLAKKRGVLPICGNNREGYDRVKGVNEVQVACQEKREDIVPTVTTERQTGVKRPR